MCIAQHVMRLATHVSVPEATRLQCTLEALEQNLHFGPETLFCCSI